ncbi:terminase [Bacillus sp. T17B1]|uniref:terminase n=1 Tax=Bacillus sp. T17B1 TaxID=2918911 RepID=UPI003B01FDC3
MAYEEKTDWLPDDPINEDDVNRWEKGIKDAHTDLAAHKNDMNNPHNTTKAQIGLGNVDNVKQAAKKDFDQHEQDLVRHITEEEREKWNGGQLSKITNDNGQPMFSITSDFHTELLNYPTLTYFSYSGTSLNSPGGSGRGFWTCCDSKLNGHVIVMTNDNKTFRKTLLNGNWSNWIELETTAGAEMKVSNHAKDSIAHITVAERNKWNAGQSSKITNDAGGVFISIGDSDDFLSKIVKSGERFGTFYSTGKPTNAPSTLSTRGFFHFTATDSNGNGTFGYVVAIDYRNNMFTNYVDGNLVWQGWNKIENASDAQTKADKSLADAKNYVDTNYSNQKLTILTGSSAIQDARTGGNEYPPGLTLMDIGQENTTGYPGKMGFVKNEKYNNYRFAQYFYTNGNFSYSFAGTGTWIRQWYPQSGWSEWEKISGFAHVNVGTTGKQELIKGETQKINYNRIIKDSHKIYDTNNSRFIASHSGMYLVGASLIIENTLQYSNFELYIYVNGSKYKLMDQYRMPSPKDNNDTSEFNATVTGSVTVPLNAGDYIEIYVYVGYSGSATRYVQDRDGIINYFDIIELGGHNYPRV